MGALVVRLILIAVLYFLINKVIRFFILKQKYRRDSTAFFKTENQSPYEVLGVSPSSSEDEITKAYKEALKQYHPDKVAQMGSEIQDLARRKTEQIISAYKALAEKK